MILLGHHRHRLKELGKQRSLGGSLKKKKIPDNDKHKLLIGQNSRANQTAREAREESFSLLSRTYKLESKQKKAAKLKNHNFVSKSSPQISQLSPFIWQKFGNSRTPKASLVKVPSSAPRDSFEIVSEENGSTQSKMKDEVLLETLMQTDTDSDSNQPITGDSEQDGNADGSVPGNVRGGVNHVAKKERPDDSDEEELLHKDDLETKERSNYDHDKNIDDDDDADGPNDDNEDEDNAKEKKPEKIENQEPQLQKMKHDENQNISPYEISDQMSQDLTRIHGGIEDQTAILIEQERHLQAMNELRAYSAQIKQKMLQRLRFSYGNIVNQNGVVVPQYYISQPLTVPGVAVKVPSLVRPSGLVLRAAFLKPMQRADSLPQSNSQGYSINVNGLHGVFSKTPGYVVRFHSPDSEVTVVKKQHVTDPVGVK